MMVAGTPAGEPPPGIDAAADAGRQIGNGRTGNDAAVLASCGRATAWPYTVVASDSQISRNNTGAALNSNLLREPAARH
jgi:hypothetical protein